MAVHLEFKFLPQWRRSWCSTVARPQRMVPAVQAASRGSCDGYDAPGMARTSTPSSRVGRLGRGERGQQGYVPGRAVQRAGRGSPESGDGRAEKDTYVSSRASSLAHEGATRQLATRPGTSRGASFWRPSRHRVRATSSWQGQDEGRRPGTS